MGDEPIAGTLAIVLAAGSGRRFGAVKQLAELEGRPLVAHAVDAARRAGIERVVVVAGPRADDVVAAVDGEPGVRTVVNEAHASGQASSLVAGLDAAAQTDAQVAVVLMADQPGIEPSVIVEVARTAAGGEVARAVYDDGPGHPVALPRPLWGWIVEHVSGDEGARQLFERLDVTELRVDGPAPADIDTPADLDASRRGVDERQ